MANQNKQYICNNPGCENFYDSYEIIISKNDVIPGTESETCCPKCSMPLMDFELYINEQKDLKNSKRKKMLVIGFSALLVVGIALAAYFVLIPMLGQKSTETVKKPDVEMAEPTAANQTAKQPATKNKAAATNDGQSKTFSDGSKYVGSLKNGKMDGMGTYYYAKRQLISEKDLKKRYAEKGDYFIGEFHEDRVVSGKLYNSDNEVKEVIIIGR